MQIYPSTELDLPPIKKLLEDCDLPNEDIDQHGKKFLIVKDGRTLIGVIGLEILGSTGLLRSLAVEKDHRGTGIAKSLYNEMQAHAKHEGISTFYLLTITAEKFFAKLGFERVPRERAPEVIQATQEFQTLCPVSSVCMTKAI